MNRVSTTPIAMSKFAPLYQRGRAGPAICNPLLAGARTTLGAYADADIDRSDEHCCGEP